jgi:hypothetical protein
MTPTLLALAMVLCFGRVVFSLGLRAADREREERQAPQSREHSPVEAEHEMAQRAL